MSEKVVTTVTMPEELWKRVNHILIDKREPSMAALIRELLEQWVNSEEEGENE